MKIDKNRANIVFKFLKRKGRDYLKTMKIYECEKCKGLGLSGVGSYRINGYLSCSWNGEFCEECSGVGFKGSVFIEGEQIDLTHFICKNCKGVGCKKCNEGVVDWVSHVMG